jgi:hypothetical protein
VWTANKTKEMEIPSSLKHKVIHHNLCLLYQVRSVMWAEEEHPRWKGPPPKFEVTYDDTNGFILQVRCLLKHGEKARKL